MCRQIVKGLAQFVPPAASLAQQLLSNKNVEAATLAWRVSLAVLRLLKLDVDLRALPLLRGIENLLISEVGQLSTLFAAL